MDLSKIVQRLLTYPMSEWDSLQDRAYMWLMDHGIKEDLDAVWVDIKYQASEAFLKRNMPKSIKEIAKSRLTDKELEKDAPSTGLRQLDKLIKGFIPGHLYTVTGMTNVGKTSISANFSFNVADQGKRVLYFSLEPAETIVEYLASVKYIKPFQDISIAELSEDIPNIDVFTKDQVDTIEDVLRVIRNLPRYDLIVIDHLGYFTRGMNGNINQEQSNVVKQLVQIAKEKRSAVIQIVHVNKSTTDVPNMKNISGSAALYQDATDVLIVMRSVDETTLDGVQKQYLDSGFIIVEKTKSGPTGVVPIKFMPLSAYITDGSPRLDDLEKDMHKTLC